MFSLDELVLIIALVVFILYRIIIYLTFSTKLGNPDDFADPNSRPRPYLLFADFANTVVHRLKTNFLYSFAGNHLTNRPVKLSLPGLGIFSTNIVVEGSDNGVLCLSDAYSATAAADVWLWNPALGQVKKLPADNSAGRESAAGDAFRLGVGYHAVSDDMRVVRVWRKPGSSYGFRSHPLEDLFAPGSRASVYSLRSNSWRPIAMTTSTPTYPVQTSSSIFGPLPANGIHLTYPDFGSTFNLNGRTHWSMTHTTVDSDGILDHSLVIVAFDFATEAFALMTLPSQKKRLTPIAVNCVGKLFDRVSVVCNELFRNKAIHVWVMKEYGVTESWTKHVTIRFDFIPDKKLKLIESISITNVGYVVVVRRFDGMTWYNVNDIRDKLFCGNSMVRNLVAEFTPTNYRLT